MKKILLLLAIIMTSVVANAKTDKLYSTGLTNSASSATIIDTWTLEWTANNNNSARAFSDMSSSIFKYKKLHINVDSGFESTSYRVILYCNNRTTSNAFVGTYTGSATLILTDLNYTTDRYDNNGYDDINIICVAGNGTSGSVTFKDIYLETEEYEALTVTTTINSSSTGTEPFAWYLNNKIVANNLGKTDNGTIFGYTGTLNLENGYFTLSGYDKLKVTLNEFNSTLSKQIRFLAGEGTTNIIDLVDGTTIYSQDLTVTKCTGIKSANGASTCQNIKQIDFIKEYKPSSTTSFNIAASESSTVAYDRTFTVGQKSTVCLPFGLTAEEVSAAGKFYTLSEASTERMLFVEVTETEAYKPYVFVPAVEQPFANLANKKIEATPSTEAEYATTVGEGESAYTFQGTLAHQSLPSGVYGYNSSNGKFSKTTSAAVTIDAFCAYLKAPSEASFSKSVIDADFLEGEITGISGTTFLNDKGQMINDNLSTTCKDARWLIMVSGQWSMVNYQRGFI